MRRWDSVFLLLRFLSFLLYFSSSIEESTVIIFRLSLISYSPGILKLSVVAFLINVAAPKVSATDLVAYHPSSLVVFADTLGVVSVLTSTCSYATPSYDAAVNGRNGL